MRTLLYLFLLSSCLLFSQKRTMYVSEEKPTTSAYITFTVDSKTGTEETFNGDQFAFGTLVPRIEPSETNTAEIELMRKVMIYLAKIYLRTDPAYEIRLQDSLYVFRKRD